MLPSDAALPTQTPGLSPSRVTELEQLASCEFRRYARRARRYLDNIHDAEDAVQDALLSAYQHLSTFRSQAKLSTWVTTIVINAARARRRRHKPSLSYEQILETSESPMLVAKFSQDGRPSPEEIYAGNELSHLLLTLVDQLAPIYRTAVYLFHIQGLNTEAASSALGIPVPTFKAHLVRARKQLRQKIKESVSLRSRNAPYD